MDEFVKKLIEKLQKEEQKEAHDYNYNVATAFHTAIQMVKQLAEEYTSTEHINCSSDCSTDLISRSAVIKELNGIYLDNPWDDKEDILEKAIAVVDHMPAPYRPKGE